MLLRRAELPVLLMLLLLAPPGVAAGRLPIKNGQLPATPLPQTRARSALDNERLYFGMRDSEFSEYVRQQGWVAIERNARLQRQQAVAVTYQPAGELLALDNEPPVFMQGMFVRVFFDRTRLSGLQLLPNFSEGGFKLSELPRLCRALLPDTAIPLRFQVVPEDPGQQVTEAILGRIPEVFADLIGRAPLPFQSLIVRP